MKMIKCARCGVVEELVTTEAERIAEYEKYFGKYHPNEVEILCEKCWQKFHPDKHPHLVEEAMAEHARRREESGK